MIKIYQYQLNSKYANGPGGPRKNSSPRKLNLTNSILDKDDFVYESAFYMKYETHG